MMDYERLTREELIRMLKLEDGRRSIVTEREEAGGHEEHERLLHELQVHQLELEAQNQALREAQGHVEESRSRYVDLYDFAPIAYCTLDRDGVVLEINLTGASMLGKERSRIIGKPLLALVRFSDPDALARHIRESLEAVIPVLGELTIATDRGPMEVQLLSTAVRRPHGAPTSCRTAFVDVTQRRLAEREAKAAHALEKALRGRIEGIDRASGRVSAALTKLSGADIGDLLQVVADEARELARARYAALGIGGKKGEAFNPWVFSGLGGEQARAIGRAPKATGILGAVIHAGRSIRLRDLREHGSFSGFPSHHPSMTSFLGVPIRYDGQNRGNLYLANKEGSDEFSEEDQTVIEMLAERAGIAMEIARLRQVEAREHLRLGFLAKAGPLLAQSIEFQTTLHAIAGLMVPEIADLSSIHLVEDGLLRLVVAHHDDPRKKALLDEIVAKTRLVRPPEWVRAAIETGRPQRSDVTPDLLSNAIADAALRDAVRDLEMTCMIVAPMIVRGRVVGTLDLFLSGKRPRYSDGDLLLAQEIAHHAALTIEGARQYRVAQNAVRARDDMLAVVSHDLRNYLTGIRMGAELLARSLPIDEARGRHVVESIQRSATRMVQLVDGLRDATMIETGHFTIEPKSEDAAALVDDAFKTLAPQTEAQSLALEERVEGALPAIRCDGQRILQVFANLVGNAIKFTAPGGKISIGAKSAGDAVCFSVSDTGKGIEAKALAHVFDRYRTGHAGTREGTGHGLFIAKGIVEAHGGKMWAESVLGVGTTFYFALPVASPAGDLPIDSLPVRSIEQPASR